MHEVNFEGETERKKLIYIHVHCIREKEREGGIDNEEESSRELRRIKWATKMS